MKKILSILLCSLMALSMTGCSSGEKDVDELNFYERIAYQIMSDHIDQYDISKFKLTDSKHTQKAQKFDGKDGYMVKVSGSVSSSEMVWANKINVHYWLSKDKKTYSPMYIKFDKNTLLTEKIAKKNKQFNKVSEIEY